MGVTSSSTDRLTFNKAVSIINEAFAYMVMDDRWLLWKQVAEYRNKKTGEAELNEQMSNAHVGDENDQREVRVLPREDKETGVKGKWSGDNKTRFSIFRKYAL
eukprot:4358727-Ditylum_brightwellii.AAC.1